MSEEASTSAALSLTDAQKERIERNRQRAVALKSAKLSAHPYAKTEIAANGKTTVNVKGTKFVDSGGGFLINPDAAAFAKKAGPNAASSSSQPSSSSSQQQFDGPPVYEKCTDCLEEYTESYLLEKFGVSVCDRCRDQDGTHALITRTEAKAEYLLKDCDLDKRQPPLRFICRKNPHNERWGDMKLYLHLQVEQRALEVWGSEEGLMAQKEQLDEKRDKAKLSKYNKNMRQLRMEMRSSLFDKTTAASHEHVYGEEEEEAYDEDRDVYTQVCKECGFVNEYEKM